MSEPEEKHCWQVVSGELEYIHQNHYRDLSKVVSHGFFDVRDEATAKWKELSMANVDNAHYRARVIKVY